MEPIEIVKMSTIKQFTFGEYSCSVCQGIAVTAILRVEERTPQMSRVSLMSSIQGVRPFPVWRSRAFGHMKGENMVFDVSAPVMSISMEHQHVAVAQKFQANVNFFGVVTDIYWKAKRWSFT
ncbi:hypothetical protein K2173_013747 [Erythroxylum novogranatense]|uniref:Uncharacterized protein n=1 Tax=Erythroxylum novogranatense TaxID=1862640 RepID=A0AAV8SAE3_9ROSI|nr:hypothetical protein K2173_013747 [Erythroxylum novogranatense]